MVPSDLSMSSLSDALQDVNLLFLDGYSHEMMAVAVARQVNNFLSVASLQHQSSQILDP
jgi:hypothetical protein